MFCGNCGVHLTSNTSRIVIDINTVNEAFAEGNLDLEMSRILRELARAFEDGRVSNGHALMDHNGNRVGKVNMK